jgi:MFS transporter, DHA3 family, macrolide efflux protein
VLVFAGFVLAVLTVPLARGRFSRLAEVRIAAPAALLASLLAQVLVLRVLREGDPLLLGLGHVSTYLLAAVFVWRNRHIPGLWLVALGGMANLAAISANGGVMPASPEAWAVAGLPEKVAFSNSATVEGARLAFLGDVFAIPSPLPLANVFSVGDVLLIAGAFVVLHQLTGSRLLPSGRHQFSELRHHHGFVRLWAAQGVSNLGDWTYSLAVASSLAGRADATHVLATLLITQVGPAAVVGLIGGPLIDRLNRTRLMVATDVVRALAVGTLVFAGELSLPHVYMVAGLLGLCGAMFQPAMHASLPNLVPRERLVAANALVGGTYHAAVMIGPVLGGVLVATLGQDRAFALNALTFALSAVLIMRIRMPRPDVVEHPPPLAALREGFRYSVTTPLVRGILIVLGVIVFAAAVRSPIEPVFVLETLGRDPTALGIVGGAWGLGMVLGSLAAPAAARRWPRERLLWISVAVVGVAVLAASRATVLSPVLIFWMFAGAGNSLGTIAYESLLQERTPDALRGRVMAAVEAAIHLAFLFGALAAGYLGSALGVRGAYLVSGCLFLTAALLSRRVLAPHRTGFAWSPEPVVDGVGEAAGASDADAGDPRGAGGTAGDAADVTASPGDGWVRLLPSVRRALVVAGDLGRAWSLCAALDAGGWAVDRAARARDLEATLGRSGAPTLVILDPHTTDGDLAGLVAALRAAPGWDGVRILVVDGPLAGPLLEAGADGLLAGTEDAERIRRRAEVVAL